METLYLYVNAGATFKMVELANGSIAGTETNIADTDNDGVLILTNVSEKPIFLVEGDVTPMATCDCKVPLTLKYGRPEVLEALTAESMYLINDLHPKCNYGKSMSNAWQGLDEAITLNIGEGDNSDEWEIDGLYLHDPVGLEGAVTVDFLDKNNEIVRTLTCNMDGQAIYPYNATGYTYVWKRFENLKIRASFVRIHKPNNTSIGEFVLCGRSLSTCTGDGIAPVAPLAALPTVDGNTVNLQWTANTFQDWSNFRIQMFDNIQNPVGTAKTTSQTSINLDITGLPCNTPYTVRITSVDCENMQSMATIANFNTPACSNVPEPPSGANCACQPKPISQNNVNVTYEMSNGQQMPASASLYDACAEDATDKLPYRMFDEQNKLGAICQNSYVTGGNVPDFYTCTQGNDQFPVNEWFPGWPSIVAQYPFKAVVHFNEAQAFNGVYIYDGPDQGKIGIEYRSSADQPWVTLGLPDGKSYITRNFHKWVKIFNSNQILVASDLRVTIKDEHARFAELSLCRNNIVRKEGSISKNKASSITLEDTDLGIRAINENVAERNEDKVNEITKNEPRIYPNPTHNEIFVELNATAAQHLTISDLSGKVLDNNIITEGQTTLKYSLESYAQGVYVVTLYDNEKAVWRTRVVKQ
jgi:hypothetical protein